MAFWLFLGFIVHNCTRISIKFIGSVPDLQNLPVRFELRWLDKSWGCKILLFTPTINWETDLLSLQTVFHLLDLSAEWRLHCLKTNLLHMQMLVPTITRSVASFGIITWALYNVPECWSQPQACCAVSRCRYCHCLAESPTEEFWVGYCSCSSWRSYTRGHRVYEIE